MPRLDNRRASLRGRLLALALASMLPVLVFAGYMAEQYERASRQAVLGDLIDRTRSKVAEVDQVLQAATLSLGALAESEAARTGDWQALHDHARRFIARESSLRAITLVDRDGRMVFFSGAPFGSPTFAVGDMASVRTVFDTGRPRVSTAFAVPVSPSTVVAV